MECVAAEMGWVSLEQAAVRVNQTLTALAGELPGFLLSRQHQDGWIPTFFSRETGKALGHGQPYTALDSGLNSAGVLFARTFFVNRRAAADNAGFAVLVDNISRLGMPLSVSCVTATATVCACVTVTVCACVLCHCLYLCLCFV